MTIPGRSASPIRAPSPSEDGWEVVSDQFFCPPPPTPSSAILSTLKEVARNEVVQGALGTVTSLTRQTVASLASQCSSENLGEVLDRVTSLTTQVAGVIADQCNSGIVQQTAEKIRALTIQGAQCQAVSNEETLTKPLDLTHIKKLAHMLIDLQDQLEKLRQDASPEPYMIQLLQHRLKTIRKIENALLKAYEEQLQNDALLMQNECKEFTSLFKRLQIRTINTEILDGPNLQKLLNEQGPPQIKEDKTQPFVDSLNGYGYLLSPTDSWPCNQKQDAYFFKSDYLQIHDCEIALCETNGYASDMLGTYVISELSDPSSRRANLFPPLPLFGIFKGDRGNICSSYVARNLAKVLQEKILYLCGKDSPLKEKTDLLIFCNALRLALFTLHEEFHYYTTGTTALIGIIKDRALYIANIGDSRAILFQEQGQPRQLTEDARPHETRYEAIIQALGGNVVYRKGESPSIPRINDVISTGSAIGHHDIPGVNPTVDLRVVPLPEEGGYCMLACSEFWKFLSPQRVSQSLQKQDNKTHLTRTIHMVHAAYFDKGSENRPGNILALLVKIPCSSEYLSKHIFSLQNIKCGSFTYSPCRGTRLDDSSPWPEKSDMDDRDFYFKEASWVSAGKLSSYGGACIARGRQAIMEETYCMESLSINNSLKVPFFGIFKGETASEVKESIAHQLISQLARCDSMSTKEIQDTLRSVVERSSNSHATQIYIALICQNHLFTVGNTPNSKYLLIHANKEPIRQQKESFPLFGRSLIYTTIADIPDSGCFILGSEGLWHSTSPEHIQEGIENSLTTTRSEQLAENLAFSAWNNKSPFNITVIVAKIYPA